MTGTETTVLSEFIPLGVAIATGLSAFGVALATHVWSKRKVAIDPKPIQMQTPVSKEYEKTMAVMMGRIADTLETQTAILDKIERHMMVLISRKE